MKLKSQYKRPVVIKVDLDYTISLVMMTTTPPNPPPRPRGSGEKGDSPFASPFSERPFN